MTRWQHYVDDAAHARQIVDDLCAWRRSLLKFKRYATRDGDWLIDGRPWMNGERTHVATVDFWLRELKWLLKECEKRTKVGDHAFMRALDIVRTGERLGAQNDLAVYSPAITARHRQRIAMQKKNLSKALNSSERTTCEELCAQYWKARKRPIKRGAKSDMMRAVAKESGLTVRRVRSYLEKLPVPPTNLQA